MKTISIVIPLYNCPIESFKRCLNSIEKQTCKEDIEVIVVDDQSTINYTDIFNEYSKTLNLKVIQNKVNGGPGTSRRNGMKIATGEYIMFVDADDELNDSLSVITLYNYMMMNPDLNMVCGKAKEEFESGNYGLMYTDFIWIFAKMFKLSFLRENHIEFNDTRANEDNGFATLFKLCTDNYIFTEDIIYIWHYEPNSITRINDHAYYFNSIEGYIDNMIWVYNETKSRNRELREKSINQFTSVWLRLYIYSIEMIYTKAKPDVDKLNSWIIKYYNNCYKYIRPHVSLEQLEYNYKNIIKSSVEVLSECIISLSFPDYEKKIINGEKFFEI